MTEHIGNSFVILGYNGRDGVITDKNGLIYMRARYYSPEMRRFINADILHGEISDSTSLNRYSYVNGNPVSFVDPFGLSKERGGPTVGEALSTAYLGAEAIALNPMTPLTPNPLDDIIFALSRNVFMSSPFWVTVPLPSQSSDLIENHGMEAVKSALDKRALYKNIVI